MNADDERSQGRRDPGDIPWRYRLYNGLMDRVVARLGLLCAPAYYLARAVSIGRAVFFTCVNEFQKTRIGTCGRGVRLHGRVRITGASRLSLGSNVHINDNAFIRAEGGVSIGDNVHISRNLVLYSMSHEYEGALLPYDHSLRERGVVIGRNAWIGMNVVIAPGSVIGEGAIIGIGAAVSGRVEPLAIVGAVPPAEIKRRQASHYRALDDQRQYSGASGYRNQELD